MATLSKAGLTARIEDARRGEMALVQNFGTGLVAGGTVVGSVANLFAMPWQYEATIVAATVLCIGVALLGASRIGARAA